jgi:tRNA threonylcarbamoyladenosine biosynthesis protein TsaB
VLNSSSFILAIDTSSRRGSIALSAGGRLAASYGLESDAPQSAGLWENVDMLLVRAGRTVRDVSAVAVACGPGSFTGLRVGMAASMGIARALGCPLYGASTLELTARACGAARDVWAVLNAHRGEVYAQRFAVGRDGAVAARTAAVVAPPETVFAGFDDGPLRIAGDGADLFVDRLAVEASTRGLAVERPAVASAVEEGWQLAPAPAFLAQELAALVAQWIEEGRPPGSVEPCYVRPSQAEVNLRAGRLGRTSREGER